MATQSRCGHSPRCRRRSFAGRSTSAALRSRCASFGISGIRPTPGRCVFPAQPVALRQGRKQWRPQEGHRQRAGANWYRPTKSRSQVLPVKSYICHPTATISIWLQIVAKLPALQRRMKSRCRVRSEKWLLDIRIEDGSQSGLRPAGCQLAGSGDGRTGSRRPAASRNPRCAMTRASPSSWVTSTALIPATLIGSASSINMLASTMRYHD
jgi:hypothetical protein